MNKIIIFIITFVLILANKVFAVSYDAKNIKLSQNPTIQNTQENINSSKLIEKYLLKLKNNINSFNDKYNIKDDKEIKKFMDKLDKMIFSLRKIQTISIEKNIFETVLKDIIDDLKTLNIEIKSYLKEKRRLVELETKNTKNNYIDLCNKLSSKLSIFISEISSKEIKNNAKIKVHIENLEKENKKLVNFKSIIFQNSEQVKSSFLRILNNIKKEFIEIKKLL